MIVTYLPSYIIPEKQFCKVMLAFDTSPVSAANKTKKDHVDLDLTCDTWQKMFMLAESSDRRFARFGTVIRSK